MVSCNQFQYLCFSIIINFYNQLSYVNCQISLTLAAGKALGHVVLDKNVRNDAMNLMKTMGNAAMGKQPKPPPPVPPVSPLPQIQMPNQDQQKQSSLFSNNMDQLEKKNQGLIQNNPPQNNNYDGDYQSDNNISKHIPNQLKDNNFPLIKIPKIPNINNLDNNIPDPSGSQSLEKIPLKPKFNQPDHRSGGQRQDKFEPNPFKNLQNPNFNPSFNKNKNPDIPQDVIDTFNNFSSLDNPNNDYLGQSLKKSKSNQNIPKDIQTINKFKSKDNVDKPLQPDSSTSDQNPKKFNVHHFSFNKSPKLPINNNLDNDSPNKLKTQQFENFPFEPKFNKPDHKLNGQRPDRFDQDQFNLPENPNLNPPLDEVNKKQNPDILQDDSFNNFSNLNDLQNDNFTPPMISKSEHKNPNIIHQNIKIKDNNIDKIISKDTPYDDFNEYNIDEIEKEREELKKEMKKIIELKQKMLNMEKKMHKEYYEDIENMRSGLPKSIDEQYEIQSETAPNYKNKKQLIPHTRKYNEFENINFEQPQNGYNEMLRDMNLPSSIIRTTTNNQPSMMSKTTNNQQTSMIQNTQQTNPVVVQKGSEVPQGYHVEYKSLGSLLFGRFGLGK